MEGNQPQQIISVNKAKYYSARYIADHFICNQSVPAIYARLQKQGKAAVKLGKLYYWSTEQVRKLQQSYEDDIRFKKEFQSSDLLTVRQIAETIKLLDPNSLVNASYVNRYIRKCGFSPTKKVPINGTLTFLYDQSVLAVCKRHFLNKNKLRSDEIKDDGFDRERATLLDRIQDEKKRNKQLNNKIESSRNKVKKLGDLISEYDKRITYKGESRTPEQLLELLKQRDKSIAGYKGAIKASQKKIKVLESREVVQTTFSKQDNKLYTIREMAECIKTKDNANVNVRCSRISGFIHYHEIKPAGKNGQSKLYSRNVLDTLKDEYDEETIQKRKEEIEAKWLKSANELAIALEKNNKLHDQQEEILKLKDELNIKSQKINELSSEIEEYEKKLRGNILSRLKLVFT